MTIDEAKEFLMSFKSDNNWGGSIEEALDMAIQALEKQVAIKPDKLVNVFGENEYNCKECENEIYRSIFYNYCPSCGKKIDWSDEE